MQLAGFNHLHEEFYGKQVFDMLNELQVCVQCLFQQDLEGAKYFTPNFRGTIFEFP